MNDINVEKEADRIHVSSLAKTAARCLFGSVLVFTIGMVTCAPSCAEENQWRGKAQQCDSDMSDFRTLCLQGNPK